MIEHRVYWDGSMVPCVRTTQKQKFVDPRYQKYHQWKRSFRLWANTQGFPEDLDLAKSYHIDITIRLKGRTRYDLDNAIKGVLDSLFKQDRRIIQIEARILERDSVESVEVLLREVES